MINDPGVADDWRLVNFIASRPIYLFNGLRLAEEKSRSLTLFRTLGVKDAQNLHLAAMNRIEDTRHSSSKLPDEEKEFFHPFFVAVSVRETQRGARSYMGRKSLSCEAPAREWPSSRNSRQDRRWLVVRSVILGPTVPN